MALTPPSNVVATRTSATSVKITWKNGSTASGVFTQIEVSRNQGAYFFAAQPASGATSWTGTYSEGTIYQFRILHSNGTQDSAYAYSDWVYDIPNPPSNVSATRATDNEATVTWTVGAETGTRPISNTCIERQDDAGSYVQLIQPISSYSSWSDSSISKNHRYRYRLRAKNKSGYSSYASSGYIYTTPATPSSITATKTSANAVTVGGSYSNATYATGVDIQRSQDGGTWTTLASNTTLPYSDTITGTTVQYRIRSVRGSLASGWKTSSVIEGIKPPLAPTITEKPSGTVLSGSSVTIKWTPNHPDGTSQTAAQVEVTDPNGTATTTNLTTAKTRTFTPSALGVWSARVRTKGLHADWGAWSSTFSWRMADAPIVAITQPATDGTVISNMPLIVSWTVTDVSGASSSRLEIIEDGGDTLFNQTYSGSPSSTSLPRTALALKNDGSYTIRVTVSNGYGLKTEALRTFATLWNSPAVPSVEVAEGEGASASITVGTGQGSTVPTESITVQRVGADGSAWTVATGLQDGDTVSDPLAPLGVDVTYRAIAYASSGASSASEAVANIRSSGWVLGFGDAAGEWLVLVGNPDSSYSLEQGGELFHFADGGAGGGLPVWYGTTDRDEGGSLSFGTVGQHDSDRLRELARKWPVGWLRDPFGHRWRARILPSVKHGLGELWTVGIDWTAVRWREAWDG